MTPTFQPRKPFRHRARAAQAQQVTPPPVGGAVVVSAFLGEGGEQCTLVFDRPVAIHAPFDFGDGSIQFNDVNPVGVSVAGVGGNALEFAMPSAISPDSGWNVNAQPAWLTTPVAVPQNGSIA
jgi:hypothetical protein